MIYRLRLWIKVGIGVEQLFEDVMGVPDVAFDDAFVGIKRFRVVQRRNYQGAPRFGSTWGMGVGVGIGVAVGVGNAALTIF